MAATGDVLTLGVSTAGSHESLLDGFVEKTAGGRAGKAGDQSIIHGPHPSAPPGFPTES